MTRLGLLREEQRAVDARTPEQRLVNSPRLLNPFDVMRAMRTLAPHDARLNDRRWLIGEALRRVHARAWQDPCEGLPNALTGDAAIVAQAKLSAAEIQVGPAAWPIVVRIVLEGSGVRECRGYVPEVPTPWRVDAVITDRLRVALDRLGPLVGVKTST